MTEIPLLATKGSLAFHHQPFLPLAQGSILFLNANTLGRITLSPYCEYSIQSGTLTLEQNLNISQVKLLTNEEY